MLSSWQISQMHQQQQAGFAQQSAYSQQISSQMPQPYGGYVGQGLGATGFGGGFQGGGYSYGGGVGGYGPGNAFGNMASSAVFGAGAGVGKMMGIGGGILGGMAGGLGGALLGGGIGGLAGMPIAHAFGSMATGAAEQGAVERTLSQFQFMNSASRTGRGFTRQDTMGIGNMVRQMERIPEMLTSFGELNRIMDKMGQMGLMQGVRDAGDFQKKFKDTVKTLKDMSKVIGGTMEEALQMFGESRKAGFYSTADIMKNAVNRQVVGATTGMSQGQVGALQQYGADMGHATGGSRASGSRLVSRTAAQYGMMNQMGVISNEDIMEMTGKEGAEGIQDMAAQMSQASYRMSRTSLGTASTLALGEMVGGRFTGKMDEDLVARYRRGEFSLSELKQMAKNKAGTRGAKLSFRAHEKRLRSEMASATGAEGQAMMLKELLGERGWENPDAINLVMQKFQYTEEQANLLQKIMPSMDTAGSRLDVAQKEEAKRSARLAATQQNFGWDAVKKKMATKIAHYTTDWAKDIGVGVRDYFQIWADEFLDDVTGQVRRQVTEGVANTVRGAAAGNAQSKQRLAQILANPALQGGLARGARLDIGASGGISGLLAETVHSLTGNDTSGEAAERRLGAMGGGYEGGFIDRRAGRADKIAAQGGTVLSNYSGYVSSLTQDKAKEAMAYAQDLSGGRGKYLYNRLAGSSIGADIEGLSEVYTGLTSGGKLGQIADEGARMDEALKALRKDKRFAGAVQAAGGKEVDVLAALAAKEGGQYRGSIDVGKAIGQTVSGLNLTDTASFSKEREKIDRGMAKYKGSDTEASWEEAKSMIDKGDPYAALLIGNEKQAGLLPGKEETEATAAQRRVLQQALEKKDPTQWSDKEKEVMKNLNLDPAQVASELIKDPKRFQKLQTFGKRLVEDNEKIAGLSSMGFDIAGLFGSAGVLAYASMSGVEGVAAIADDMKRAGSAMSAKLTDKDNVKSVERLAGGGKHAEEFLKLYKEVAEEQQGGIATLIKMAKPGYKSKSGAMAKALYGMSSEGRGLAESAGLIDEATQASFGEYSGVMERGKKLAKRGRFGKKTGLDKLGIDKDYFGKSAEGREMYEELEKMVKGGKTVGVDKDEVEKVAGIVGDSAALKLRAKAGGVAESKHVSETEVASMLKDMQTNNTQMASFLTQIATGKAK